MKQALRTLYSEKQGNQNQPLEVLEDMSDQGLNIQEIPK